MVAVKVMMKMGTSMKVKEVMMTVKVATSNNGDGEGSYVNW